MSQASKVDEEQPLIANTLQAYSPAAAADVCVIGCGPAGLALSSELAKRGLSVCLIGNTKLANKRLVMPSTLTHHSSFEQGHVTQARMFPLSTTMESG